MATEVAVFGGGCFWCTEAAFRTLPGVSEVVPGYSGGACEKPSYEQVCSGATGHAEVTKITFDSEKLVFKTLLETFFKVHDPTTLNRQGHDVGSQYRSVIFYTSDEQRQEAELYIEGLNKSDRFGDPIVTEIVPLDKFWPAEDYHRDYYERNKNAPYCRAVIKPKLDKLKAV